MGLEADCLGESDVISVFLFLTLRKQEQLPE